MNKKVAVAMSGGVDSSVSAYLLQKEGYDVHGVFIQVLTPDTIPCSAPQDKKDSMRACANLGIPFIEYDATEVYRKNVIEPFVESYKSGDTPNPDIFCNTFVKFGAMYDFLRKKNFEIMATGHYAQTIEENGVKKLLRAVDDNKDQTYFIHTISSEVLNSILFPVGKYHKNEVRRIASRANLVAAKKKDSTGFCFLGDISIREFLSHYIPFEKGEVRLNTTEEIIGEHNGASFVTIGQRSGFTTNTNIPYIVIKKDMQKNILYVEPIGNKIGKTSYVLKDITFREEPESNLLARYRHRGELCNVTYNNGMVLFSNPQNIAAGQAIVLYKKNGVCIGGGLVS